MDNDTGGGGADRYAPAFTEMDVVPQDLADFARLVGSDLDAIRTVWDQLRTDMESGPNPNFSGGFTSDVSYSNGYPEVLDNASPGIYEGQQFNRAYFLTLGAERMLMDDLIQGFETLQLAATMIHDGYLASDAASSDNLAGAFAAYERSDVLDALDQATTPDPPPLAA